MDNIDVPASTSAAGWCVKCSIREDQKTPAVFIYDGSGYCEDHFQELVESREEFKQNVKNIEDCLDLEGEMTLGQITKATGLPRDEVEACIGWSEKIEIVDRKGNAAIYDVVGEE